jgi:PKHD-type hydroxylase
VVDFLTVQGEYVRKLSFSLQLSDPEDYTGGEVQFIDNSRKSFFAPKQKGTIILFDSRTPHRVRKIKSGLRKSLVGWVVGPRWK